MEEEERELMRQRSHEEQRRRAQEEMERRRAQEEIEARARQEQQQHQQQQQQQQQQHGLAHHQPAPASALTQPKAPISQGPTDSRILQQSQPAGGVLLRPGDFAPSAAEKAAAAAAASEAAASKGRGGQGKQAGRGDGGLPASMTASTPSGNSAHATVARMRAEAEAQALREVSLERIAKLPLSLDRVAEELLPAISLYLCILDLLQPRLL